MIIQLNGYEIPKEVYEENWILRNILPNNLRASIFVSYYSLLEKELLRICRIIDTDNRLVIDKKNKGIYKAKNYFQKETGFDLNTICEWKILLEYNRLRNQIVHYGLYAHEKTHKQLVDFIGSQKSLRLDDGNIKISEMFLPEVSKTIKEFFLNLHKAILDEFR